MDMLDIYTDYLICQNKYATATGLSDMVDGEFSHDKVIIFLRQKFHKSIKQNASLEKSPTKKVKTQCNHVFAAMISYCKLEMLKFKTCLNHFAIKYKLIVRANQIAMQELKNMAC